MVRPIPEYFYSGNNMNQNHHIWYHESPHLLLTAIGLFLTITALVSLCAHHRTTRSSTSQSTKGSTTSKKQQREKQLKGDKDIYIMSTTTSTYTNSTHETGLESKLQKKGNHNNTPAIKEVAPVSSMDNSEKRETPPPPPQELRLVVPPRSPLRSVLTSPLRSPLMRSPKRFFTTINDKAISPLFRGKKRGGCGGGEIYDHDGFTSDDEELYEEEEGVWQKNILLGDKCRPLEFSGVIYYDCSGKRVDDIPRSPHRATPPSSPYHRGFSFPVAGELM